MKSGIERIVDIAGDRRTVYTRLDVKPQALQEWLTQGYFPISRAIQVQGIWPGVPFADLVRPDIGSAIRKSA